MTDQTPQVDHALVARTTFEKEAVWLPHLAVQHFNDGQSVISGKTFTDCLIEGPAVMMVVDGVSFDGCNMGVTGDPANLLIRPVGERLTGVVPFRDTKFVRCQFVRIAFTGHPDFIAGFGEGLKKTSDLIKAEADRARSEGA